MAAKKAVVRESDRTAKAGNKRTSQPKGALGAASKQKDRPEPRGTASRVSPLGAAPSLAERVEVQREQLFKTLSIVECCKFATATLLEVDDSEYMVPAFETICDLRPLHLRLASWTIQESQQKQLISVKHRTGSRLQHKHGCC